MLFVWLLVFFLIALALIGGIVVSNFLFVLLALALAIAARASTANANGPSRAF